MSDLLSDPSLPLPMGVTEEGKPAPGIELSTVRKLGDRQTGTVPKEILEGKANDTKDHYGMVGGEMNANDLEKAGWSIMYGRSIDPQIKTNLTRLVEHRRQQVGDPRRFQILDPPDPGQSACDWLFARKNSLNVVNPLKGVPYYVLIVASPEDISFQFQYELDLYWGVGRLWLETPADFERYAHSVVDYEMLTRVPTARKLTVFAPDYEERDNGAGKMLRDNLVHPMTSSELFEQEDFAVESYVGDAAKKAQLNDIFMGESGTPAMLFTGSHGLLKNAASAQLPRAQGALLCQEWDGEAPRKDVYYSASDLPERAKLHGMVHFLFACYGMGWPKTDTYDYANPEQISPAPMMARLPQTLLGRENGALAVLGHIDRAWSSSYRVNSEPMEQSFVDVLVKMMSGYRLGNATDQFNMRWAALSLPVLETMGRMPYKKGLEPELAKLLIRRDDARNYILHGDPAVRLRVSKVEMPVI